MSFSNNGILRFNIYYIVYMYISIVKQYKQYVQNSVTNIAILHNKYTFIFVQIITNRMFWTKNAWNFLISKERYTFLIKISIYYLINLCLKYLLICIIILSIHIKIYVSLYVSNVMLSKLRINVSYKTNRKTLIFKTS